MKLTTQQKKKILEKKELEFLKYLAELAKTSQYFSLRDETQELYKTFTNIELINDLKDPDLQYSECKSFIFYPMEFKVTKLSYMIYPSSSENDLNAFKTKRNLFIKYLKIFSKSDNNEIDNNGIYDKYEKENNKMTKKYFDKLKTCRAIKGEKYKTYILRLKIIGCTPLPDSLWKNELTLGVK
ncbi:uncharacterized protein LOC113557735 [Rhopalosiphum maidis]|uniref:uncharacterized protein LOC113557735 n=1 Tax=Rhopalosiphum maidis TaxID=43146 RepID=UPI00101D3A7D|nr:uncharacterized protein LOC113557735 [Rhopalosiphum maidis]